MGIARAGAGQGTYRRLRVRGCKRVRGRVWSVGVHVEDIVRPDLFESHLAATRARDFATDVEEFAENLYCVAAPIIGEDGEVEGAIGFSTSVGRFVGQARSLVDLVRRALDEASTLLARKSCAIASKDR